ncbi:MAG TPA: flagellar export protein FliJ [Pseudomonadales bacterium]|nr:flagellar export protein FliJ [Pseudomonadales bacterium]
MKSFRFPLEPLRVLRKQKERAAQQRYAQSLMACKTAAAQLDQAIQELDAGRDFLMRELSSGISAAKIVNLRTWCLALEIHQHERKAALNEKKRIADMAFQEMTAATRDREGLDRFYDKARRTYTQEVMREEQRNFDELAVQLNGATGLLQNNLTET